MADIIQLGYDVDTSDLVRGEKSLDRLEGATGRADKSTKNFEKTQRGLGGAMAGVAAKLGVLAAGYVSVQAAMSSIGTARGFSSAVSEVSTLIDGSVQQITALEGAARSMSREFGGSSTAQVNAFYQAISAGAGDVGQATTLLDAANRLAIGGITDVTTGVDVLTTAMNAYGPEVLSAAQASDALFVGMRAGKTTIGELSASIGNVLPLASALGVSFDETVAATAALTTQGLTTAQSVTGLRAALTAVTGPTKQAADLAKSLGLEFNSSALESKGLAGFLNEVIAKTGGSADAMRALFGSVEATTAVLALAGGGAEALATTMDSMATKTGAAQTAFDKMAADLDQRLNVQMAILGDAALTVGQVLLSVAVPAIEATTAAAALLKDNAGLVGVILATMAATQIPAAITAMLALTAGVSASSIAMGVATAAATAMRGALIALGGPLGLVYGLLGGAAAYFLVYKDNAGKAETATYDAAAATAALGSELSVFYRTDAPSAGKAAIALANANNKLAASAYDAAKAELAKRRAMLDMAGSSGAGGTSGSIRDMGASASNEAVKYEAALARMTAAEAGLEQSIRDRKTAAVAVAGGDFSGVTLPALETPSITPLDVPSLLGGGSLPSGASPDGYQSALETLTDSLATEREILDEWHREGKDILADRRAQELLTEDEHKQALTRLEEKYQSELRDLQAKGGQQRLTASATIFGALANIASAGGKRMAKAAAASEAIVGTVNAYGAAIKAMNTPGLPWPARFAAYASVLAAGMKGVSAIKSAGGGGGGVSAGGGASGGISATAEVDAEPSKIITIDMPNADEWLKVMAEELFGKFQTQMNNGGVLVQ